MTTADEDWDEEEAKYIVFKLSDWKQFTLPPTPLPLDDAVVIRLKDPFAATALFTYCNTIMSSLELLEGFITEEDEKRLLDIADYFHQQACESQQIKGKRLPD